MSPNARLAGFVLGALAVAGGVLLSAQADGGGIPLLIIGALILVSLLLEPRYGRPRAPTSVPPSAWQPTGERFIDDETGQPLAVWIDPLTGERRYEPLADDPRLTTRKD
jgi:hypothetical protein